MIKFPPRFKNDLLFTTLIHCKCAWGLNKNADKSDNVQTVKITLENKIRCTLKERNVKQPLAGSGQMATLAVG